MHNDENFNTQYSIDKLITVQTDKIPKIVQSPLLIFLIIIFSIFTTEIIVMLVLSLPIKEAVIDAVMQTGILLPVLYFLIYKPFQLYISQLTKMQKKLNEAAVTDDLTGLFNRRGFFIIAEKQCSIAGRNKMNLYFLFIDIDGLKEVNDKHGHKEGDKLLVKAANILKDSFRLSDIISRIGGDEFTVMIMETPETNIDLLVKRLNDNLDNFNSKTGNLFKLSFSFGLTKYSYEKECAISDLIAEADKMMYEQKRKKQE